jgi:hypothetical protein
MMRLHVRSFAATNEIGLLLFDTETLTGYTRGCGLYLQFSVIQSEPFYEIERIDRFAPPKNLARSPVNRETAQNGCRASVCHGIHPMDLVRVGGGWQLFLYESAVYTCIRQHVGTRWLCFCSSLGVQQLFL